VRLTNKRIYLDYNSTSPLAPSVKEWLAKGDFVFANPASVHTSGKQTNRYINETSEYLCHLFGNSTAQFELLFHSGGTEGINTFIKGFAAQKQLEGQAIDFYYTSTDHSSVKATAKYLADRGHRTHIIPVDSNGNFDDQILIEKMNQSPGPVLYNFTSVNNETGVQFKLQRAEKIKEATGCKVHVDAVQAIGKVEGWQALSEGLDAYTFSAHKFGAMKGVGFSFFKKQFQFLPLIEGGGQQNGHRAGTENAMGIYSVFLALREMVESQQLVKLKEAKELFEDRFLNLVGTKGQIIAHTGSRNSNTTNLILDGINSQTSAAAFDMAGIDVSIGPACSSGVNEPSPVLLAMGYSEQQALSALRLSFSPYFDNIELDHTWQAVSNVLTGLIK
jgi:cysteine desulfurase